MKPIDRSTIEGLELALLLAYALGVVRWIARQTPDAGAEAWVDRVDYLLGQRESEPPPFGGYGLDQTKH